MSKSLKIAGWKYGSTPQEYPIVLQCPQQIQGIFPVGFVNIDRIPIRIAIRAEGIDTAPACTEGGS